MDKSKIDVDAVLIRLKQELDVTSDTELAKIFEVSNKTISSWRSRNSIPIEVLLQATVSTNHRIDYFLFGSEEKREFNRLDDQSLSDRNVKNYRILGRSILIGVLSEFAPEELAFIDDSELAEKGDQYGSSLLLAHNQIRIERMALVDSGKIDEEAFIEYASKLNQPSMRYFTEGIKHRRSLKKKGPQ